MRWVVIKISSDTHDLFGPVFADNAYQACDGIARGTAQFSGQAETVAYHPQGRGRYVAVPLEVWQDGAHEFTKTHGSTPLFSGV